MTINPGILRHSVNIESLQGSTPDGFGNVTKAWTVLYSNVPAYVKVINAKEVFADAQVQSQNFFDITIRYLPSLSSAMRLRYNGRVFAIMSLSNFEERNVYLILQCREIFAE